MSQENIEQQLILNDSLKDSIEQPPNAVPRAQSAQRVQPIHEQPIEEPIAPEVAQQRFNQQRVNQQRKIEQQPPRPREAQKNAQHNSSIITDGSRNMSTASQSVISQVDRPPNLKRPAKKRYKVLLGCSFACVLIGIVFIFALPPFIQDMIVEQSIDQVIMKHENEGLWAHFPGDTNTTITRNFTFFKLINEDEFLIHHAKPQFQEVSNFKIQELQDFLDITYLDDGNKVKIRDWLRFKQWPESKSLDQKVSILNLGNIGYWSTLKNARPTLILQQGLGLLFSNLQASILPTLLGTGINSQYLKDFNTTVNSFLIPAGVQAESFEFMWNDPIYGLGNPDNLGIWVQATQQSWDNEGKIYKYSKTANLLKNYFVLTDSQLYYLMQSFYSFLKNIKTLLLENHYCVGINMSECTGRYLAVAQFAEGWATAYPPPVSTIRPNDTICDNNVTCKNYYPEIYAFYKNIYLKHLKPNNDVYAFDRQQILGWFNYNFTLAPTDKWNKAQNCLLHIGNLDQIWQWGTYYDQTKDQGTLQLIRKRLKITQPNQADVAWEWLKYMSRYFVKQNQATDLLGVANLFSQGLYDQFSRTMDQIQTLLLTKLLQKQLQTLQCHLFFESSFQLPEKSKLVNDLCNQYTNIHSVQFAEMMVQSCQNKFGSAWQSFRKRGLSLLSLEYHCEINGKDNVGTMLHNIKVALDKRYSCDLTPKPYCSKFQLAAKQWSSSAITLSPPEEIAKQFPRSLTLSDWGVNTSPYEYAYYKNKLTQSERAKFPNYTTKDLTTKLNFNQWFSASSMLRHFAQKQFEPHFIDYIRWFSIKVSLRGFSTSRTVREILFGYEDEFLAQIKNSPPPFGGDPSAPSVIALNDLNLTEAEANQTIVFLTGKDDFRNVYQNYQINGYRYLVNQKASFNGNQTESAWKSPWAQEDYFYGTTAKIFAPNQFVSDNLSLLIPQVQRYGSNFFHNQSYPKQRYGITVYESYLSPYIGEIAPHNDKYYQTLENVFNVSSIYGLPLYITKNHFMNCTQWLSKVDIYGEGLKTPYQNISHWDDTFIIVQPYTGVSFQSVIYLQNNYYHQPDFLYTYPTNVLLPIFSISRSGNLTEQKVHQLYGPLVIGLKAKDYVVYIGIGMAVVFGLLLICSAFFVFKKRPAESRNQGSPSLSVSLQEPSSVAVEQASQRLVLEEDQ